MFDPSHFDVIITFCKSRYKAETPFFPGCKAYGKTEKEALEKLSTQLALKMKVLLKKQLNQAFISEKYSELILDPHNKKQVQHRRYVIPQNVSDFLLKLDMKDHFTKKKEINASTSEDVALAEEMLSQIQDVISDLLQIKNKPPFITFQIPFGLN